MLPCSACGKPTGGTCQVPLQGRKQGMLCGRPGCADHLRDGRCLAHQRVGGEPYWDPTKKPPEPFRPPPRKKPKPKTPEDEIEFCDLEEMEGVDD